MTPVCHVQSRRLESDHIDVVAAHPGMAVTDHFGKADTEHKLSSWMIETLANSPIGQTKEQGAIALEYAGVSPDVNGAQGLPIAMHATWELNACPQERGPPAGGAPSNSVSLCRATQVRIVRCA